MTINLEELKKLALAYRIVCGFDAALTPAGTIWAKFTASEDGKLHCEILRDGDVKLGAEVGE